MSASRMAMMVFAVLLLAYPLSTDPVSCWQLGRSYKDYKPLPTALQTFYWPIRKVCELQFFSRLSYAYGWLWLPKEARENYNMIAPWELWK
jgi:hypothetical protein